MSPEDSKTWFEQNRLVEITQSAMGTFLGCKQQFVFQYMMRLRRRETSVALIVGSAVHSALEILLEDDGVSDKEKIINARSAIDLYFEKELEKSDLLAPANLAKMEHGRAQAHAVINAWYVLEKDTFDNYKILETEMKVRAEKGATMDSPVEDRMAGMLDGIIEDKHKDIWQLEHKTRSRLDNLDTTKLDLDMQALWYVILCRIVLKKKGKDLNPKGFLYNAIQKPSHRLNDKGFDDLKERMYDAMIKDPDKYISLTPILFEENIIKRAWKNFKIIINEMDNLTNENVTMNLKACNNYGACPYVPLCQYGADASDPEQVMQTPGIDFYDMLDESETHSELN